MEENPIEVEWTYSGGQWGVSCKINETYRRHADKIWRSPKIVEMIVQKCEVVFKSLSWNLRWMEVRFSKYGVGIEVEGVNGCYCAPIHSGSYISHNIDNSDQTLCIYLCLRTAMDIIETALEYWEEQEQNAKNLFFEEEPKDTLVFHFDKDLDFWELYKVTVIHFDEPQLDFTKWIWAKGFTQAREISEEQASLFKSSAHISSVKEGPTLVLRS